MRERSERCVGEGHDPGPTTVFTRTGGVWTEQALLTPAVGAVSDYFGYSVTIDHVSRTQAHATCRRRRSGHADAVRCARRNDRI